MPLRYGSVGSLVKGEKNRRNLGIEDFLVTNFCYKNCYQLLKIMHTLRNWGKGIPGQRVEVIAFT